MSDLTNQQAIMRQLLSDDSECYPHFLHDQFPHIFERMIGLWGKPQMSDYLDGLLSPVRKGAVGFPEQALEEILKIKSFCFPPPTIEAIAPRVLLPVRETLSKFFQIDHETYPKELEIRHPEVLQGILALLGSLGLDAHIESLLRYEKQVEHTFSEQALFEMLTIKSLNHGLRKIEATEPDKVINDDNDDDEALMASHVFDRVHRW